MQSTTSKNEINPLLKDFTSPYGIPPFTEINVEHYLPAFYEAIKIHNQEIKDIIGNSGKPDFINTIEALENSGQLLERVERIFNNLLNSNTSDRLQEIAIEISPVMTRHEDDIYHNKNLYDKIKAVYFNKENLNLNTEQKTLLEKYHKDFTRAGAGLEDTKKEELKEINEKLSVLSVKFADNVLKEDNEFVLILENNSDLDGLPRDLIKNAEIKALERGLSGKWIFTLHKSSLIPFLQYSSNRNFREKIFTAFINRGNNNNDFDNKKIVSEIISLRIRKANLLGFGTFADFSLEKCMAKNTSEVFKLLEKLWKPSLDSAVKESDELQRCIIRNGDDHKLEAWDWWYYSEKVRKEKYELSEEILRPYFMLEHVRDGAFAVANNLYGLTFARIDDVPFYHDDIDAFKVLDSEGECKGILYLDYFSRASKRGGAWMDEFRVQHKNKNRNIIPVVVNVFNFAKPSQDQPALLSFEEVSTLFHEFGHALHGLLSDCQYKSLSGTAVARDFVELPSQFMENWAGEPEVLKLYAKHYKTNETIPDELIKRIRNSEKFNQGFNTTEYLSAAFLDMNWHILNASSEIDVEKFERETLAAIGLIPEIKVRYRSTYFSHIFDNDYSAGYYSYIWAQVLDADAFEKFKQNGIFDKDSARSFKENILARGATEDPMILYKRFRGKEPDIEPLLKRKGFI